MITQVLENLGLSKNEALIYETLVREGASPVGRIAVKSRVHRRNVYDTLNRLLEHGLVYEILSERERMYQAVEPDKLISILEEKEEKLSAILPAMEEAYQESGDAQRTCIYRGPEGWKNYMRDMIRESDEAYFIAAKGGWLDERVSGFFPSFRRQAEEKGMKYWHLFDYEVKEQLPQILPHVGSNYKFLPKGFSGPGAVDIFGDRVNLLNDVRLGRLGDEIQFIVIINREVADAFRTWFRLMWDLCLEQS